MKNQIRLRKFLELNNNYWLQTQLGSNCVGELIKIEEEGIILKNPFIDCSIGFIDSTLSDAFPEIFIRFDNIIAISLWDHPIPKNLTEFSKLSEIQP